MLVNEILINYLHFCFIENISFMRKKIIAGNWKMNMLKDSSIALFDKISSTEIPSNTSVIIIPPAVYIDPLNLANNSKIELGAQNCHSELFGAFTGEISASMLKDLGVNYCLVGHSERRMYFHESDEFLKDKINTLLNENITPIFCCGETLTQREKGEDKITVEKQIKNALFHLDGNVLKQVIIAYEPVWAIGTGKTATPTQAQEMHSFIRELINTKYGREVSSSISILYGGSVKGDNAKELFAQQDIDGGLIGGASLKAEEFITIIHS